MRKNVATTEMRVLVMVLTPLVLEATSGGDAGPPRNIPLSPFVRTASSGAVSLQTQQYIPLRVFFNRNRLPSGLHPGI